MQHSAATGISATKPSAGHHCKWHSMHARRPLLPPSLTPARWQSMFISTPVPLENTCRKTTVAVRAATATSRAPAALPCTASSRAPALGRHGAATAAHIPLCKAIQGQVVHIAGPDVEAVACQAGRGGETRRESWQQWGRRRDGPLGSPPTTQASDQMLRGTAHVAAGSRPCPPLPLAAAPATAAAPPRPPHTLTSGRRRLRSGRS